MELRWLLSCCKVFGCLVVAVEQRWKRTEPMPAVVLLLRYLFAALLSHHRLSHACFVVFVGGLGCRVSLLSCV
jgi:hypothetical protein